MRPCELLVGRDCSPRDLLTEPAMSTILRECFAVARQGWKASGFPVIILATTCDVDKIPTGVLGAFKEEISIEVRPPPSSLCALTYLLTL